MRIFSKPSFLDKQRDSRGFVMGVIVLIAMNAVIYVGCAGGLDLFSTTDDINFGKQMQAQIAKDPGQYPVLNNPQVRNYLQGIENRIIQSPNVTNKGFNYQITLIHDDKTVNAFTLPGGPIYVYTGLLKFVDDEATIAGILAHETTHADHRHGTKQMTQQYGLQMIASAALGNNPGLIQTIVANLGTNLTMLKFSRNDENEADKGSFDDLNKLPGRPWYPAAINEFMKKVLGSEHYSGLDQLFLTHPPSQERYDLVSGYARAANLPAATESQLNSSQYRRYRAMLP